VATNDPILVTEIFDFRSEMNNVVDAFREETGRKGLQLSADLGSDMLPTLVKGNPARLRQAISNILSNAVENTTNGIIVFNLNVL
jgi:signal transduction histidine kinase